MVNDTEFKYLSEQQLQYIQFKAHQIFQELKEEQQWENFCNKNSVFSSSPQQDVKMIQKSDFAVQVECIKDKPEPLPSVKGRLIKQESGGTSNSRSGNTVVRPAINVNDINLIKRKLDDLELIIHKLKDDQHNFLNHNKVILKSTVPKYKMTEAFKVGRAQVFQNALKSVLKKLYLEEPTRPKYVNSSYLLPESLRVQRIISRHAYEKSNPPKPTNKHKTISKISSRVSDQRQSRLHVVKKKSSKMSTDQGVPKLSKKISKRNIESAPKNASRISAENTKPECNKDEELNALAKKISEIENIENNIQQRLDILKQSLKPTVSKECNLHNSTRKEKLTTSEILDSNTFTKDAKEHSPSIKVPVTMPCITSSACQKTHRKKLCDDFQTNSPSAQKIDLHISGSSLRSIHHHRKLFRRYLCHTAHQEIDTFNPWALANSISDYLIDDCIEEIVHELEKIPSSFVMDLYNQEFAQSIF